MDSIYWHEILIVSLKIFAFLVHGIHPHALRHTFATRCFESGIGAKTVQTWLGHSSVAITLDLYTHVTDDKSKCDMDKLDQVYQKLG